MDKQELMTAVRSGVTLTADEQDHLEAALGSHELLESVAPAVNAFLSNPAVKAFDWTNLFKIFTPLLSIFGALIPGLGPILALLPNINKIIELINELLKIFKINPLPPVPPIPIPVPNGGGFIPVTPVDLG